MILASSGANPRRYFARKPSDRFDVSQIAGS
jgi:hypothetical protein